ncbi:MAG TPA: hypothetical protein VL598_11545 [Trinickia sp.]|uniref:hypothetical protein n=1 Tax=Trinickia sp. TaxID=2571163 RepID=UPI002C33CFB4|nr:hypothetical protein [Trinickia sp.]HTI18289.1 hypothetical protein [Trinickia sp.]
MLIEPLAQQPISPFVRANVGNGHASASGFQRHYITCTKVFPPIRDSLKHIRSVLSIDFILPAHAHTGEPKTN